MVGKVIEANPWTTASSILCVFFISFIITLAHHPHGNVFATYRLRGTSTPGQAAELLLFFFVSSLCRFDVAHSPLLGLIL